jgi:hypothetical protein
MDFDDLNPQDSQLADQAAAIFADPDPGAGGTANVDTDAAGGRAAEPAAPAATPPAQDQPPAWFTDYANEQRQFRQEIDQRFQQLFQPEEPDPWAGLDPDTFDPNDPQQLLALVEQAAERKLQERFGQVEPVLQELQASHLQTQAEQAVNSKLTELGWPEAEERQEIRQALAAYAGSYLPYMNGNLQASVSAAADFVGKLRETWMKAAVDAHIAQSRNVASASNPGSTGVPVTTFPGEIEVNRNTSMADLVPQILARMNSG